MDAIEEKAKELIGRFYQNPYRQEASAKVCAIICCEEMIALTYTVQLPLEFNSSDEAIKWFQSVEKQMKFYKAVKEKIKSL